MPNDFPVYPSVLADAGYHVGLTGKGWGPGDFKSTGWKHNPAGPSYDRKTYKPPYTGMSKNDYAANFADFLSQRKVRDPFYFWLGSTEPHQVYEKGGGTGEQKAIGRQGAEILAGQRHHQIGLARLCAGSGG